MSAKESFQRAGHSDSGTGADLPRDLYIPVTPLGVGLMCCCRQHKEPIHALHGKISCLAIVLSASHELPYEGGEYKTRSITKSLFAYRTDLASSSPCVLVVTATLVRARTFNWKLTRKSLHHCL